jgi:hypothetical protein
MSTPRRVFVDTEWTAAPWDDDMELLWIGLADESGASWSSFVAGVEPPPRGDLIHLIPDGEPRLDRVELATAIVDFCGDVDEFWAWVPTVESVAAWFGLGDEAPDLYARYWDIDLQMLQWIVEPWPETWPTTLSNLCAAATEAGIDLPDRRPDHLNPRVHAAWNAEVFGRIARVA